MFTTILTVHILGAIFVGALVLLTLFTVSTGKLDGIPVRVRVLALGLFFEIGTGSLLAMLTPGLSLIAFCQNIGLYTGIVLTVFLIVYVKLSVLGRSEVFPKRFVVMSTAGALATTAPAFFSIIA